MESGQLPQNAADDTISRRSRREQNKEQKRTSKQGRSTATEHAPFEDVSPINCQVNSSAGHSNCLCSVLLMDKEALSLIRDYWTIWWCVFSPVIVRYRYTLPLIYYMYGFYRSSFYTVCGTYWGELNKTTLGCGIGPRAYFCPLGFLLCSVCVCVFSDWIQKRDLRNTGWIGSVFHHPMEKLLLFLDNKIPQGCFRK